MIERDASLARLIAALSIDLAEPLAELPSGAEAVFGQVIHSPAVDAWMIDHRTQLAMLCLAATEAEMLTALPPHKETQLLKATVDELADWLLTAVNDRR